MQKKYYILEPFWFFVLMSFSLLTPFKNLAFIGLCISSTISLYRFLLIIKPKYLKNNINNTFKYLLIFFFILGFILFFQVNIIHDAFQYYAYMKSLIIDKDLNLYNDIFIHNSNQFYNPFPKDSARYIGTILFETPFFILGHFFSMVLKIKNILIPLNGYNFIYQLFVSFSSSFFCILGLLCNYLICNRFFSKKISFISVISVLFASPLVFFMYTWNSWPHPYVFFTISLFIYIYLNTYNKRNIKDWILLGIVFGLTILIRPNCIFIIMLPLFDLFNNKNSNSLINFLIFLISAFIVFLPQFFVWKTITNNFISFPYKEVGDYYAYSVKNIFYILFSTPRHGLFIWSPIFAFIFGLVFFVKKNKKLAYFAIFSSLFTLILYSSWSIWWSGIGFSNRFFICLTPFLILSVASVIEKLQNKISFEFIIGILTFFIVWNFLMIISYRSNYIPQGIPGPFRNVGYKFDVFILIYKLLILTPAQIFKLFRGTWINEIYFINEIIHGMFFKTILSIIIITIIVYNIIKLFYFLKNNYKRLILLYIGSLFLYIALFIFLIFIAKKNTKPFGNFYHFDEINFCVEKNTEPVHIYSDYPLKTNTVDIISFLAYAYIIPQNTNVAKIKVYDVNGNVYFKTLKAGVDTAENSYLKPESKNLINHSISKTNIVRHQRSKIYSKFSYDLIEFHSQFKLPKKILIKSIKVEYLYKYGKIIIKDIFIRDF